MLVELFLKTKVNLDKHTNLDEALSIRDCEEFEAGFVIVQVALFESVLLSLISIFSSSAFPLGKTIAVSSVCQKRQKKL